MPSRPLRPSRYRLRGATLSKPSPVLQAPTPAMGNHIMGQTWHRKKQQDLLRATRHFGHCIHDALVMDGGVAAQLYKQCRPNMTTSLSYQGEFLEVSVSWRSHIARAFCGRPPSIRQHGYHTYLPQHFSHAHYYICQNTTQV